MRRKDFKLSQHFWYSEMIVSETAERHDLENEPGDEELENLRLLTRTLEQARTILGSHPVTVKSGFRTPEVNCIVGGVATRESLYEMANRSEFEVVRSHATYRMQRGLFQRSNSDHTEGRAVDFICPGSGDPYTICRILEASAIVFDQLILEYYRWVHLGVPRRGSAPRRLLLTYRKGFPPTEGFIASSVGTDRADPGDS